MIASLFSDLPKISVVEHHAAIGSTNDRARELAALDTPEIALVVAETEKQAEHARDLIEVDYEDLPVLTDPREAMKEDALQLHPDKPGNLLQHYRVRKGDVDDVWDKCAAIVVGEYQTPFQEHAYLQPEAGLAYLDEEGRVTVQVAGQWTHEDQEQIAHALQLPLDQLAGALEFLVPQHEPVHPFGEVFELGHLSGARPSEATERPLGGARA